MRYLLLLSLVGCYTDVTWSAVRPTSAEGAWLTGSPRSGGRRDGGSEFIALRTEPLAVGAWISVDILREKGPMPMERLVIDIDDPTVVDVAQRVDGKDLTTLDLSIQGEGEAHVNALAARGPAGPELVVIARQPDEARLLAREPSGLGSVSLSDGGLLRLLPDHRVLLDVTLVDDELGVLHGFDAVVVDGPSGRTLRVQQLATSDGDGGLAEIEALLPAEPLPVEVSTSAGRTLATFDVRVHTTSDVSRFDVLVGPSSLRAEVDVEEGAVFAPQIYVHDDSYGTMRGNELYFADGSPTMTEVCLVGTSLCREVEVPGSVIPAELFFNDLYNWCGCSTAGPSVAPALLLLGLRRRRR